MEICGHSVSGQNSTLFTIGFRRVKCTKSDTAVSIIFMQVYADHEICKNNIHQNVEFKKVFLSFLFYVPCLGKKQCLQGLSFFP